MRAKVAATPSLMVSTKLPPSPRPKRAEGVGKIVAVAKKSKLVTASGIYSSSQGVEAIVNSRGLSVFHRQTSAEVSITMLAGNSSGWQKANSPDVRNVDPLHLAEISAQKARDSKAPQELSLGNTQSSLEPAAALDLVGFMFWDFGGMAILEPAVIPLEQSYRHRNFLSENITIVDDITHPLQSNAPLYGEGVARRRVNLGGKGCDPSSGIRARHSGEDAQICSKKIKLGKFRRLGRGFPVAQRDG